MPLPSNGAEELVFKALTGCACLIAAALVVVGALLS